MMLSECAPGPQAEAGAVSGDAAAERVDLFPLNRDPVILDKATRARTVWLPCPAHNV